MFRSSASHTEHPSRFVSQPVLLFLVTSLVLSRLDCGSVTLNGITRRLMDRLQSVLNAAERLVYNSRKYDRITSLLRDLHRLRVPERIQFRLAVFVFRCRNQTQLNTSRETYSGLMTTSLADDYDRRQLTSWLCAAHDSVQSVIVRSVLPHLECGPICLPTSSPHRPLPPSNSV